MKYELRQNATVLRKSGHSYNYIAEKVGVSKSTLSYWLADIPYTPNAETIKRIGNARAQSGRVKSKQKLESILKAQEVAKKDIGTLSKRDLFMLGIGLYIGEGGKTFNIIRLINSNPMVIKAIIKWFMGVCDLTKENFTLAIHLYPDNNVETCLKYWEQETRIPREQFGKTQIDRRKDKKFGKKGKLPYGTAHLTIRSNGKREHGVFLSRKINAWMEESLKQVSK